MQGKCAFKRQMLEHLATGQTFRNYLIYANKVWQSPCNRGNIIGICDLRSNDIGKSPINLKVHTNTQYCTGLLFVGNILYFFLLYDLLPKLRYFNKIFSLASRCF